MKKIISVIIEKRIEVEIDESKFDETFLREFRQMFHQFETLEDHMEHLAQLKARGFVDDWSPDKEGVFIEGYGGVNLMGIKLVEVFKDWQIDQSPN